VLHLHRGTPYIYQGEELGMTNVPFDDVASFRDIESLRYYENATTRLGEDPAVVLDALRRKSRDNARTPMQWTGLPGAGFSTGTPWIPVNPNHTWLNAARQRGDPRSVYHYYRALIALRHTDPVVVDGRFALLETAGEQVYAFCRTLGRERIEINANLSDSPSSFDDGDLLESPILLGNYLPSDRMPGRLAPWEARVYRR
jgi:oligo-1,6-glucosidase